MKRLLLRLICIIFFLAAFIVLIPSFISAQENDFKNSRNKMTLNAWLEDFDSFYKVMSENNNFFKLKERKFGFNWLNLKQSFRTRIEKAKSDYECFEVLYDAVTALQNGHTSIVDPDILEMAGRYYYSLAPGIKEYNNNWRPIFNEYYKNHFQIEYEPQIVYEKGKYIIAGKNRIEKYGSHSQVIDVNGIPIDAAVKSGYTKYFLNYDYKRNKPYASIIHPNIFGPDAKFKIRTSAGVIKIVSLPIVGNPKLSPSNEYVMPEPRIIFKSWPDKKAAYVWINDFNDNRDHDTLISFYKSIEKYDLLIIDVRGNRGGSYAPWKNNIISPLAKKPLTAHMYLGYRKGELVNQRRLESNITDVIPKEYFTNLPPEVKTDDFTIYQYLQTVFPAYELKFNGKIAILTDEVTYSAADAFVLFCKETNFGKIFGTPTGGDGIAPSSISYVFPNSKLVLRFQQTLGIDYNGNAIEEVKTQPDIYYESSYNNKDELINYVLKNYPANKPFWKRITANKNLPPAARQISAAVEIDRLLETLSLEAAVSQFREMQKTDKGKYVLTGSDFFALSNKLMKKNKFNDAVELLRMMGIKSINSFINRTGYNYLNEKKFKEAIELFGINVRLNPEDYNTYDSLGEAYMLSGNKALAIENYEKSVKLNPNSQSGINALKKLKENK